MPPSLPAFIPRDAVASRELRFRWDDWEGEEDEKYDSQWIVEGLSVVEPRARVAFSIGVYEWIVWRFARLSIDPAPIQLAEAAWLGLIHSAYFSEPEFIREEWLGPVRGPLWCAMTWVSPMIKVAAGQSDEEESGLLYLPSLATYVLPDPAPFESWARAAITRLQRYHRAPPSDPLEDLFDEEAEARRGRLVAREALDPSFDYRPEMATELLSAQLRATDRANPFLQPEEDMRAEGFTGTPFVLSSP